MLISELVLVLMISIDQSLFRVGAFRFVSRGPDHAHAGTLLILPGGFLCVSLCFGLRDIHRSSVEAFAEGPK